MRSSFEPTTLHSDLFIDGAWQKAAAIVPVDKLLAEAKGEVAYRAEMADADIERQSTGP